MSRTNGIITVFEYNTSDTFEFVPVKNIKLNNYGRIDLSIFIILETDYISNRKFTVNLVHASDRQDKNLWNVNSVLLQEFTLGDEDSAKTCEITELLPTVQMFRSYIKFNMKNIPFAGYGYYTVLLNELTEEEIQENPEIVVKKFISYYPIDIIHE